MVNGERRESLKPVLYSGGVGRISDAHTVKRRPEAGMLIIRIGGPAYRIGVGGGAASSMTGGANKGELDLNSVQRGNGEYGKKAVNVIKTCVEMGKGNPIESIHDQGAGGPSNVLTELMEPVGGRVDIRKIVLGDKTMSVLEIWSAEFQEGYGLLIRPERLAEFQAICKRERVNCEVVGEITGDGKVTVTDSQNGSVPVDLKLEDILGKLPRKTFKFERPVCKLEPLKLPSNLSVEEALKKVFLLPQVGSKAFLTRKVDRSVTGLIARQQCCGPAQIPVADVAVTADGYFGKTGAALAIGEQLNKVLVNPAAGARMVVGEMLTNMVSAKISKLGDIKCRANWMWPAKLAGEGALLYEAAVALRDIMIRLGIAIDGGKDSSSMAAKVNGELVKSPGQLVLLGYAPVPDIEKVVTPDFKPITNTEIGFMDLGMGKNRLGGSSLAQACGQVGDDTPDVDDPELLKRAFEAVQELIQSGLILALHDRSDGGLITAIVEMCMAGMIGADIDLARGWDIIQFLFSEELGLVFQYRAEDRPAIEEALRKVMVPFECLGTVYAGHTTVHIWNHSTLMLDSSVEELRCWWEATSSELEKLQAKPSVIAQEKESYGRHEVRLRHYSLKFNPVPTPTEHLSAFDRPKVAVLREEGTNGDREMAAACFAAGLDPWDVNMDDLLKGRASLDRFQGLFFPGGFSFMDVFDSGKGWAGVIRFNPKLRHMFDRFYYRPDTFSLGVCNGCQLMVLLGWVPWKGIEMEKQPRFIHNASGRFESRWVDVGILPSPSVLLAGMEGSRLGVWVAHGEGRLVCPGHPTEALLGEHLAPLAYIDRNGDLTEEYPLNPNGSHFGITALCSRDGRHLAMMPHPERCFLKWQWPWMPEEWKHELKASPWLRMFQNARTWCMEHKS